MSKERAGYTVTMFIIDVSPSMGDLRTVELPPDAEGRPRSVEITNLEWSLKYVKHKIQQMIFAGRKTDRCGVVLIGTEDTDNPVSDEHGGYDNVTLYMPIHQPTHRTLAQIDEIEPSTAIGDFLDGIIVATWVQNNELGKKASWTRKLYIITDGQNPLEIEEDDVDGTVEKLNDWNVELTLIGIDFDDPDLPYEEPDKPNIKAKNEEFYKHFVDKLKFGTIGTCEYAMQVAREPDIKITRSALMSNFLTIGDVTNRPEDAISINVQLAKATSTVSPPTMKRFVKKLPPGEVESSQSGNSSDSQSQSDSSQGTMNEAPPPLLEPVEASPLDIRTEYVRKVDQKVYDEFIEMPTKQRLKDKKRKRTHEGENVELVDKTNLIRAYKYGQTWVPIEDDSSGADSMATIKGVEIVGFSYENLWPRDWSMGEVFYIFGDKSIPRAQIAFSSLVRAMNKYTRKREHAEGDENNDEDDEEPAPVLAIVRLVGRDGSPPKMGVALARSTKKIDYMVWVRAPFAEDLRRFAFPSLDVIKDKKGNSKTTHPNLPTPEMQDAMDSLVAAGDLSDTGPKDEEGNRLPWYDPSEAVHPAVHRLKEAMFHAAITTNIGEDPLPPPHPDIVKFLERPKRVITRSKKAVEKCNEEFKVVKVPKRVPFRKRKQEEELAEDAEVPITLAALLGGDAFVSTWKTDWDSAPVPYSPQKSPIRSPTKNRAKSRARLDSDDEEDDDEGSVVPDDEEARAMDIDQDVFLSAPITDAAGPMVVGEGARDNRIIGNVHPLYDFEQNISRGDVVSKAVEDLGNVIIEIVEESFSSQRFQEALECMKIMRKTAVEEDEVDAWNYFLRKFKKKCNRTEFKHPEFWKIVQLEGRSLSLIYSGEADSEVSEQDSRKFIET